MSTEPDRITLYVREHKTDDWKIVPGHPDVMAAIRAAFRFSANPSYRVTVNGRTVKERKRVIERAHVLGSHGVKSESPSTHPHYGEFTLVKTKTGSRKRVKKPVPPMSPPPVPPTQLTLPPELRQDMAAVETLSRKRANESRSVDQYDLANARRRAKREGREFNY